MLRTPRPASEIIDEIDASRPARTAGQDTLSWQDLILNQFTTATSKAFTPWRYLLRVFERRSLDRQFGPVDWRS